MVRSAHTALARAFDEARFGPARILDLRTGLPSATEAVRHAESWLRERQMARAGDVLVVTGRGRGSPGGHGVVREAVKKLFGILRSQGVIARVTEHNPGAFVVGLAPITALFDRPPRSRPRGAPETPPDPAQLAMLDADTLTELRTLAEHSLRQLGVPLGPAFVQDEMMRQFNVLARGIDPAETDKEGRFRFLIAASRAAFEEDA